MTYLSGGCTVYAPSHPHYARYYRAHDPRCMHLGVWEVAGDVELPGRVAVASGGDVGTYRGGPATLSAEEAALSLNLKPTRRYGRSLRVESDEVAIPGLLDPEAVRQVAHTAGFGRHSRPLASDIGTLSAVLMRGMAYQWQHGRPLTVVTAAYRVPPCNPHAEVYSLVETLNRLDVFARGFARQHRVPLLLGEMVGDTVYEERTCGAGHPFQCYRGKRIARTASIATTDPDTAAGFAVMARMILETG